MIGCICINDKHKPRQIPVNKWIESGKEYTIIHIGTTIGTKIPTVTLSEITLGKESYPYEGFRLDRFAFSVDDIQKLIAFMKDCSELKHIDIGELMEEMQLEILQ